MHTIISISTHYTWIFEFIAYDQSKKVLSNHKLKLKFSLEINSFQGIGNKLYQYICIREGVDNEDRNFFNPFVPLSLTLVFYKSGI